MIPRIKNLKALEEYRLYVEFDNGKSVIYDVNEDINQIPDFSVLKTEQALFNNFRLDESRTCVYWSERADLPSDIIFEYGKPINNN